MRKNHRIIQVAIGLVVGILVLPVVVFGIRAVIINWRINDDVSKLREDVIFRRPVRVANTPVIAQRITCGYATIQWMTRFLGQEVEEQALSAMNAGKITTAFPGNFGNELAKHLNGKYTVRTMRNARNTDILTAIHASVERGMPVPISFAAIDHTNRPNYSLHYSIVIGMGLERDVIDVSNVYGYEETYSVADFLAALKFENYVKMPLFIRFGVFFGMFDKNMIYLVEPV